MVGERTVDGRGTPRVAIAHDYLTQLGGAEKTVLAMSRAFPDAPIYTMLYDPDATFPEFKDLDVRVAAFDRIHPFRKHHRAALPVLPLVARSVRIDADVVLASSSGWAHGFRTTGRKLVYCHAPARWLYQSETYLGSNGGAVTRLGLRAVSGYLKKWDRKAALSGDRYLANSTEIQGRIREAYGIDADVVFPPVAQTAPDALEPMPDVRRWLAPATAEDAAPGAGHDAAIDGSFYLVVSRLLPYKNVDEIITAFADTDRKLVVVGRGPEADRLRALKTPNVTMLSDLTDGQLAWLYAHCRAIIAASYEDYGLTPLEAGAWGKPAIALRFGGFLDTIAEGVSGSYFDEPTARAIRAAVDRFEENAFDPDAVRNHVNRFSQAVFTEKLHHAVGELAAR